MILVSRLILPVFILGYTQRSRSTRADQGSPEPVTDFACWLYKFTNLTCNYTLPEGYSTETIGIVRYRNRHNTKPPKLCYNGTDRHFVVDEVATLDEFQFQVKLEDKSQNLSSESRWFDYNADDAAIPDKVMNLRVKNVTSSSLVLSWQQPGNGKKYTFKVTVSAKWEDKEQVTNVHQTNLMFLTLHNLVPGTSYTLAVQCRAYKFRGTELIGHWSYSETIMNKTKDDVPGAAPRLAPAVSRFTDTQIIIYWQLLKSRHHHGQLHGYVVELENQSHQQKVKVGPKQTSLMLNIPVPSQPVRVVVYAVNRMGSSNRSVLQVTPPRSEPSIPVYWVTGDDDGSHMTYYWDNTAVQCANCVVYWCRRLPDDRCQGQIEWKSVPCDTQTLTVDTEAIRVNTLRVGLSVEVSTGGGTVRSSIVWQHCIHTKHKEVPSPPEEFRLSTYQPPFSAHLMWNMPACNGRPYISHYILNYCSINVDGRNCTDGGESTNISNLATSYVVKNLHPETYYNFTISTVSQSIKGPNSMPVTLLVQGEFTKLNIIITAVVVGVVLIILILILGLLLKRKCRYQPLEIQTPKMDGNGTGQIAMTVLNHLLPPPRQPDIQNMNCDGQADPFLIPSLDNSVTVESDHTQGISRIPAPSQDQGSTMGMPDDSQSMPEHHETTEYSKITADDTDYVQHPSYTTTTADSLEVHHGGYIKGSEYSTSAACGVMGAHCTNVSEEISSFLPEQTPQIGVDCHLSAGRRQFSNVCSSTVEDRHSVGQHVEYIHYLKTSQNDSSNNTDICGHQSVSTSDSSRETFGHQTISASDSSAETSGYHSVPISEHHGISGYSQLSLGESDQVQHPDYTSHTVVTDGVQHADHINHMCESDGVQHADYTSHTVVTDGVQPVIQW